MSSIHNGVKNGIHNGISNGKLSLFLVNFKKRIYKLVNVQTST